jgi:hypothetical protein
MEPGTSLQLSTFQKKGIKYAETIYHQIKGAGKRTARHHTGAEAGAGTPESPRRAQARRRRNSDYAVLDDIARALSLATRELEELAVSIAVLQRREVQG